MPNHCSFDSGPLRVSPQELAKGWREIGELVIVPRVRCTEELPYDQYDEWLVLPAYTEPEVPETFVNSGLFCLAHFSTIETEATEAALNGADIVGAKYRAGLLNERQARFWDLIVRVNPESWIGSGNRFMFASRNSELFSRVFAALQNYRENL